MGLALQFVRAPLLSRLHRMEKQLDDKAATDTTQLEQTRIESTRIRGLLRLPKRVES